MEEFKIADYSAPVSNPYENNLMSNTEGSMSNNTLLILGIALAFALGVYYLNYVNKTKQKTVI